MTGQIRTSVLNIRLIRWQTVSTRLNVSMMSNEHHCTDQIQLQIGRVMGFRTTMVCSCDAPYLVHHRSVLSLLLSYDNISILVSLFVLLCTELAPPYADSNPEETENSSMPG